MVVVIMFGGTIAVVLDVVFVAAGARDDRCEAGLGRIGRGEAPFGGFGGLQRDADLAGGAQLSIVHVTNVLVVNPIFWSERESAKMVKM